jgi:sulfate transport system permease protein
VTVYLSVIVVLPIAALVWSSTKPGVGGGNFWDAVSGPEAVAALKLTFGVAALAAATNAVLGTITAWVLVRDDFRGKSLVNAIIALLFVTLPFVVRTVQPVLIELDTEMEEAGRSLGAGELTVFRRIVLPNILPGILSGVTMAFARAVGEIGALVLISGNIPYKTEVASVFIFLRIQSGDPHGAAAVATLLLAISFAVLLAVGGLRRWATRFERA